MSWKKTDKGLTITRFKIYYRELHSTQKKRKGTRPGRTSLKVDKNRQRVIMEG